MPIVLIDNHQVAAKIGRSYLYLKKARRRLQREHNFPDYVMRGLTDEAAVEAWLENGGIHQKTPRAAPVERRPRQPDAEARQRQANRNLERLKR